MPLPMPPTQWDVVGFYWYTISQLCNETMQNKLDICGIQFNSKNHLYRPPLSNIHYGRANPSMIQGDVVY